MEVASAFTRRQILESGEGVSLLGPLSITLKSLADRSLRPRLSLVGRGNKGQVPNHSDTLIDSEITQYRILNIRDEWFVNVR